MIHYAALPLVILAAHFTHGTTLSPIQYVSLYIISKCGVHEMKCSLCALCSVIQISTYISLPFWGHGMGPAPWIAGNPLSLGPCRGKTVSFRTEGTIQQGLTHCTCVKPCRLQGQMCQHPTIYGLSRRKPAE